MRLADIVGYKPYDSKNNWHPKRNDLYWKLFHFEEKYIRLRGLRRPLHNYWFWHKPACFRTPAEKLFWAQLDMRINDGTNYTPAHVQQIKADLAYIKTRQEKFYQQRGLFPGWPRRYNHPSPLRPPNAS